MNTSSRNDKTTGNDVPTEDPYVEPGSPGAPHHEPEDDSLMRDTDEEDDRDMDDPISPIDSDRS